MINQQILDYIKEQKEQGASEEAIRAALAGRGWQEGDVNEAFDHLSKSPEDQPQQMLAPQPIVSSLPGGMELLKQAWAIYQQRLSVFLGIMIIPTLVVVALMLLAVAVGGAFFGVSMLSPNISSEIAAGTMPSGIGLLIIFAILFFVIFLVIQTWGQLSLLYAIKDREENINVKESYRRGWHKIGSSWWVSFLTMLAVIGGFLLLIVPGIIFAIWFSMAIFVLVAEDLRGAKALSRSKEYVKGNWGSVFWRFLFIGVAAWIFSLILVFVFSKVPFGQEITRFASSLFITPLATIYSFLIYVNLKAMKG